MYVMLVQNTTMCWKQDNTRNLCRLICSHCNFAAGESAQQAYPPRKFCVLQAGLPRFYPNSYLQLVYQVNWHALAQYSWLKYHQTLRMSGMFARQM